MKSHSHAALTAGLTSAGSAFWIRRRIGNRLDYLEDNPHDLPSIHERLYNRGPVLIAGAVITGAATLSSAKLDNVERQLFGNEGHRKILHSIPYLTAGRSGSLSALEAIKIQVETMCEAFGIYNTNFVERAIEEASNLAEYLIDGSYFGALTHILGDLPTKGKYGVTALQSLTPFSDKGVNIGWLAHDNPALNYIALKCGLALSVASWFVAGVYAVTPRWPWKMLSDAVAAAREISINDLRGHGFEPLFTVPHQIAKAAFKVDSSQGMNADIPTYNEYNRPVVPHWFLKN